jgi:hypothetical protein
MPLFGQLDPTNLDDYYDVDIDFDGHSIQIDLNFDNKTIDPSRLDMVNKFIDNIATFDKNNKKHIEQDYADDNCDTVNTYIEYLINDNDKEDLAQFTSLENDTLNTGQQLIKAFKLVRLGLYPDSEKRFATFDYTIGRDLTDDLVVIFADQFGDMDYMTLES